MIDELEYSGNNWLWPKSMLLPVFTWRKRKKPCKISVMIVGVLDKIRTQYLPNTRLDRCSYIDMFSRDYILKEKHIAQSVSPCGGGIEYLHRDPASRRRRQKGKSQMWDSKIWSQVPRGSDQRKTALARSSGIYKSQTRPLVREGAPQKKNRNCHTSNKDLVVSPKWVLYTKTDWPADRRS
jgi:hypothetical protein